MAIKRTYLDVKTDGKIRVKANTPVNDFGPTSISNAFLDVIASETDTIYNELEYIHRSIDPTRNYGKELDNLGYMVGASRDDAVIAIDESDTNFYFYIDKRTNMTSPQQLIDALYPIKTHSNIRERLQTAGYINNATNPTELRIPAGTKVFNKDRTISYSTLTTAVISTTDAYTGVISTKEGTTSNIQSNVLIKHDMGDLALLTNIAKYILCANVFPIQTGGNGSSDAEYRYKIAMKPQERSINEQTIRSATLAIPGVRNLYFTRSLYGYGTIGVLLEGTSPLISNGLIKIVKSRLAALSGNDAVFVFAPEYKGIEMAFDITTKIGYNGDTINETVRSNIITYINNIPIGGTIVWNDVVSIIMNVEGVFDFMTNYFKLGEYNPYQKLNKKQIVLRTINQRSYETDKFYTDKGLIKVCSSQV